MLPAAAMLIALAEPLVSLFLYGQFKVRDVAPVASALRFWAMGLVFFACMMFVLRTFYSLKDTRTPMLANLALTPVQIGLYVLLTTGLLGWAGLGVNGIPLADGVFYLLMLVTLALLMRRRLGGYDFRGIASVFLRMLCASIVGGVVAFWLAWALAPPVPAFGPAIVQVTVGGAAGLTAAFGTARLLRVPEVSLATDLVRKGLSRAGRRGGRTG
jgi:putative peptidoglycan lipid II flippase